MSHVDSSSKHTESKEKQPLERVRGFIGRGWATVPIRYRTKSPDIEGWPKLRINAESASQYFNGVQQNIGVILGEASNNLVDVDLDCREAIDLAPVCLAATLCFGRKSAPRSHWLYTVPGIDRIEFKDPDRNGDEAMIVEIRGNGCQTVFPGSVHKDTGEPIEWSDTDTGTPEDARKDQLIRAVSALAACVLFVRSWGNRQDMTLYLAGALLKAGHSAEIVRGVLSAIIEMAGDEEPKKRKSAIEATIKKFEDGKDVAGVSKLEKLMSPGRFALVVEWLGLSRKKEKEAPGPCDVVYVNAADIKMRPIEWLWDGYLARGKLHILAGAVSTGKTTIAMAMAATVSMGGRWPDGSAAKKGRVMLWSGEDDIADTIGPRLLAAGADLSQITIVSGIVDDQGKRAFDPSTDIWALRERFAEENPALLIVDAVVSAVAGDSHKNAEVRRSLQPLVDLGHDYGCAVLGISHLTKGTQGRDPVERVTGSLAFGALARVVLAAAKRQEIEGGGRIMVRAKSNLGPEGGGVLYDMRVDEIPGGIMASHVLWGEAVKGNAHDLLGAAEKREEPEAVSKTEEAITFLRRELRDGPIEVKPLGKIATENGIKPDTLKRAKDILRVISAKGEGKNAPWTWGLPGADRGVPF